MTLKLSRQKIILFGASLAGLRALQCYQYSPSHQVIAFLDNDPAKHGTEINGIPILPANEVHRLDYELIIISSMYELEIQNQLTEQLRIPAEQINCFNLFRVNNNADYFHSIFTSHNILKDAQERILKHVDSGPVTQEADTRLAADLNTIHSEYPNLPQILWQILFNTHISNRALRAAERCKIFMLENTLANIESNENFNSVDKYTALRKAGLVQQAEQYVLQSNDFPLHASFNYSLLGNTAFLEQDLEKAQVYWRKDLQLRADKPDSSGTQTLISSLHETYHSLLEGKRVAVVGGAVSTDKCGAEIDNFDVIIRTNFFRSEHFEKQQEYLGSRTDIVYINSLVMSQNPESYEQILQTAIRENIFICTPHATRTDINSRYPDLLVRLVTRYPAIYYGVLLATQHIVVDILKFRPSLIKVFGSDMFSGPVVHRSGYAQYQNYWLDLGRDDLLQNFLFARDLFKLPGIVADNQLSQVLSYCKDEFIERATGRFYESRAADK